MRALIAGGALSLLLASQALAADLVARVDGGAEIARFEIADGEGWCVIWNHSVQGFEVADCYENRGGRMVLVRSHQPDFAAGLGHIPGRGRQVSDGEGGYWILDIDEPVPGDAYILRAGSPAVDHRLRTPARQVSLSAAAARRPVRISLE
ncbi:hypothetical protein OCH239_20835 [Roseivivax halodurans JCM 10272]|uniref:DUF1850 domain-containing protein n=1 Tax=Roseivivax halodurans JCM 10272 TaxID=1449350 RepID=X7EHZ8_9RHOB|nr:DUF1850 domain-containing protein [Roseivivax halodurans]ETX14801.1 hypothetical protein OCH239_20835 [Roseivivax halodurans JCM 10272]